MGAEGPEALHLYRLSVASVTERRCICHAKALHLSAKVPISFVKISDFQTPPVVFLYSL